MTNNAIDSNIPIEITKGGTGNSVLTAHSVLVGNGTSPITQLAVGTTNTALIGNTGSNPSFATVPAATITNGANGQILIGGGSALTWANITAGSNITITNGPNTLSIGSSVTGSSGASTVSFFAYANSDVANFFGNNNWQTVPYGSTLWNIGSGYDTATNYFTVPITGTYYFAFIWTGDNNGSQYPTTISFRTDISGGSGYWGSFGYNGSVFSQDGFIRRMSGIGYAEMALTAGDVVYVEVLSNTGGGTNAGIIGKSGSTYHNCFMGALM